MFKLVNYYLNPISFIVTGMRIVSLVPSWTETLLQSGAHVVGRTRFCVHAPGDIPAVGGTKDWDWERIRALRPDLLVLDQEENPRFMAEQAEIPFVATHVRSVETMGAELLKLHAATGLPALLERAREWDQLRPRENWALDQPLPGLLDWGRRPERAPRTVLYLIWRNPWMGAAPQTFAGSVLAHVGFRGLLPASDEKYPKLRLQDFPVDSTLLLFASEPFPFADKRRGLLELGFPCAFVNGESYTWFGNRSLSFLRGAE